MAYGYSSQANLRNPTAIPAKIAVSTRIPAKTESGESLAVEEMRLGGQHARQQEELLDQLRSVLERDGQQALRERNSLRQAGYRLLIRQHDLDRAGSCEFQPLMRLVRPFCDQRKLGCD
jgi:hypothetical protein